MCRIHSRAVRTKRPPQPKQHIDTIHVVAHVIMSAARGSFHQSATTSPFRTATHASFVSPSKAPQRARSGRGPEVVSALRALDLDAHAVPEVVVRRCSRRKQSRSNEIRVYQRLSRAFGRWRFLTWGDKRLSAPVQVNTLTQHAPGHRTSR